MTLTLFRWPSHAIQLNRFLHVAVRTPKVLLLLVWPLPRSLATTSGISVDFSSSPYLDVSVQAVPLVYLWIQYTIHKLHLCGLLHSEIHGSMPTYGSPWLIAVSRVLHRLLVPRHSPCALCSLTMCSLLGIRNEFCSYFSLQRINLNFFRFFEIAVITLNNYLDR